MTNRNLTIYPLGTGGWFPTTCMETLSFCFFIGDEIFILDAGTGLSRLNELSGNLFKSRWQNIKHAHIFLTHYHFDHVIGVFWVRAIFNNIPVTIYGPGEASYGKPAQDLLKELFRKPFSPIGFTELIPDASVIDLNPAGISIDVQDKSEVLNVNVQLNPNHSDPSVALRFNDMFAFVTDTPPENDTIGFARGAKILFHEVYYDSSGEFTGIDDNLSAHSNGRHTGSFGAGLIARRAGVQRLYFIHHNAEVPQVELESWAKAVGSTLGIDCRISRDMEEIEV
jgi:ribonuclease BN (tRNA processing enzyme)